MDWMDWMFPSWFRLEFCTSLWKPRPLGCSGIGKTPMACALALGQSVYSIQGKDLDSIHCTPMISVHAIMRQEGKEGPFTWLIILQQAPHVDTSTFSGPPFMESVPLTPDPDTWTRRYVIQLAGKKCHTNGMCICHTNQRCICHTDQRCMCHTTWWCICHTNQRCICHTTWRCIQLAQGNTTPISRTAVTLTDKIIRRLCHGPWETRTKGSDVHVLPPAHPWQLSSTYGAFWFMRQGLLINRFNGPGGGSCMLICFSLPCTQVLIHSFSAAILGSAVFWIALHQGPALTSILLHNLRCVSLHGNLPAIMLTIWHEVTQCG